MTQVHHTLTRRASRNRIDHESNEQEATNDNATPG